jgi:hypothetical protein
MFIAGCNETIIAQHGRWKSLTYRRYFDATVPHYTATMLLHRHSGNRFPSSTSLITDARSSSSSSSSSSLPSSPLRPPLLIR